MCVCFIGAVASVRVFFFASALKGRSGGGVSGDDDADRRNIREANH